MPPLDREVLILRHLERLSLEETAEALGITKGAASTRHTRALGRLRELLDGEREAVNDEARTARLASGSITDPVLNRLVEELVDKLQAGKTVDLDAYRLRYPEQAEKLDKLLPAMAVMAGLGWSVNPPAARGTAGD